MFHLPVAEPEITSPEHDTILRSKTRAEKIVHLKKTMRFLYDEVFGQKKESIIRTTFNQTNSSRILLFTNTSLNIEDITLFLVCFQLPLKITYVPSETNKKKVEHSDSRSSISSLTRHF